MLCSLHAGRPRAPGFGRPQEFASRGCARIAVLATSGAAALNPNTPIPGRTALFVDVDVFDHEAGAWSLWSSTDDSEVADVNALLQQAIDAGFDDVRASVHNTGCRRS